MKRPAIHELAELIPDATEAEVAALANDIRTRGQLTAILLLEGLVLDGRTRLRACELLGIEPHFVEYKGDDPVGAVASLNVRGRNLNESQRALLAAEILVRWESLPKSANWHFQAGDRASMAAEITNVSRRSVLRARALRELGIGELLRQVRHGELAVSKALASAKPEGDKPRRASSARLALRLTKRVDQLESVLHGACADPAVRAKLNERLESLAMRAYAIADGSAYAAEGGV